MYKRQAEAEKHSKSTRLIVSEVTGEKEKPSDSEKKESDVSAIESLQSQMKEVLAITRQSFGQKDKNDFTTYKCYNCNRMGHIRSQCRVPVQTVNPTSRAQYQGRGRAYTRGRMSPVEASLDVPPASDGEDMAVQHSKYQTDPNGTMIGKKKIGTKN